MGEPREYDGVTANRGCHRDAEDRDTAVRGSWLALDARSHTPRVKHSFTGRVTVTLSSPSPERPE